MSDLLSTGVSGLLAMQRALDVTSHNIANVSTPGYSRQSVQLGSVAPQSIGGSAIGRGVEITSISRSYDGLLAGQARSASSTYSRLDTFATNAQALSNLFADTTTGLGAALQKFSNAVQGVANDPTSTAARQVLLSEADGLKQRLQTYNSRLDEMASQVNAQLGSEASSITSIAQNIAQLNTQIASVSTSLGQAPNDLLDARDKQISDLAQHVNVSVVRQDDGTANVFIGSGQPLVLGSQASTIVTQQDPYDPSRTVLALKSGTSTIDVSSTLSGGSIGGLLDFRSQLLEPARNQLGQIAVGIASVVNGQHREGIDLQGNLGGDLFAVGGVRVLDRSSNAGSATLAATRVDASAMTASDYLMEYSGSAWSLRRIDTGAAVSLSGAGTAGSPFTADGLSIVVSGAAAAGDSFKIRPTASAVGGMSVLITDPSKVAAAAPIRSAVAGANTGGASISAGEVLDASNPQLRTGVAIQFIDATHYSVNGAGSFTYTSGGNIDLNGWRVAITGTPAAGDSFSVSNNAGGVGDNRNALALSEVLTRGVLAGGTESLNAATTRFVSGIGVATSQAQTSLDAQKVIADDTTAAVNQVAGVNLDEEAANMLRYQQAYQASAQIIRVTQTIFESLLQATGR
jgi:flagellar hook-associated protein 1 FlgK